jgi:hypothetical protein
MINNRMAWVELDTVDPEERDLVHACEIRGITMDELNPSPNPGISCIRYTGKRDDLVTLIDYHFNDGSEDPEFMRSLIHNIEPDKNDLTHVMDTILKILSKFDCTEVYVEDGNPYIQIADDSLECLCSNPYHKVAFQLMPTFVDDYDITDWRQAYILQNDFDNPQIKKWICDHDLITYETNRRFSKPYIRVIGTTDEVHDFFANCFDISGDIYEFCKPIAMN